MTAIVVGWLHASINYDRILPMTYGDIRLPNRFWDKVLGLDTGCWVWTACILHNGYGQFRVGPKHKQAHRVSYTALVGEIPEGLQLDHLCRVRECVNPSHLEPVTGKENCNRGLDHSANKTQCPKGHPYSGENLYIKPGRLNRICRICSRESVRKSVRKAKLNKL